MTFVDDGFTALAAGRPLPPPWDARTGPRTIDGDGSPTARTILMSSIRPGTRSPASPRAICARLCADDGLNAVVADDDPEWSKSRRRILVDLLEEYRKHTGHADVLREAVDGL